MKEVLDKTKTSFYTNIVTRDCYVFRNFGCDFFDSIIDIGANIGMFTNYARMRHIKAKIFAYEPHKDTFNYLVSSNHFMPNIMYNNEAIGDGHAMFLCDTTFVGCNQFFNAEECEKYQLTKEYDVPSITLGGIFKQYNISLNRNYFIKIDCEGGERFLLNDNDCIEIIKKSCGFAIKIHFPRTRGKSKDIERFKTFPQWNEYDTWIRGNFSDTHKIVYHMSSGMLGHGIYALTRKD